MKKWYAKSKRPGRKQVEVKEHLCAVGELSKEYGRQLGMEKETEMAGTVHDPGKLTDKFQDVLEGNASRVDHARVSAAFLWWLLIKTSKYAGKETKECISGKIASTNYAPILEAINAHHGTLLCYNQLKYSLLECMTAQKWLEGNEGKEVALTGEENYRALRDIFREELPDWKRIGIKNMTLGEEEQMLWSRMLLSCLVDADYTASAEEDGEIIPEPPKCDAENWLERLNAHRAELARNSTADKKLNALRNELFETCGRAGDHAPGIYTLTAPTGTGKTLALLHFALRQCCKNGQQRIIIVLPFITLTEQNAIEYRKILGDPSDIQRYYQKLFWKLKGKKELCEAVQNQDYAGAEKHYRIIKNDGVQVLVPYEPENKLFEKLKEEALENGVTAKWMHEAAKLCVTAYANDDFSRYAEQLYFAGKRNESRQPSGYWVLRRKDDYHMDTGMQLKNSFSIW